MKHDGGDEAEAGGVDVHGEAVGAEGFLVEEVGEAGPGAGAQTAGVGWGGARSRA